MPIESVAPEDLEETEENDKAKQKPRPVVRRRLLRRTNTVKLKADFALPIDRLARLAEQEELDEEDDSLFDPTDLDPAQPLVLPFQQTNGGNGQSTDEYLRQLQETNRIKAHIWRVPKIFAERNPLITRKPASAPGWAYQGEIPFSPDALDEDLLTLFADGFYFIEVRERGRFKAGFLKTIGNPSQPSESAAAPAIQPVIVQESQPADPIKDAKAQVYVMNSVVEAATQLLQAQAAAKPDAPKPPTLKERIEELRALQQLMQPNQPQQNPQQRDPLERFAEALESEAVKKILNVVKNDKAPLPTEPQTTFWDFAAQAAEFLAPGLNPLLAGLGRWLMMSVAPQQQGSRPDPQPQRSQNALAGANAPQATPATTNAPEEDFAVDIRFLVEDLAAQTPVAVTAQKINEIVRTKPFIRPFLTKYLSASNEEIWQDLLSLCESEEEAAQMRQALDDCAWKDDWLNNLKQALTGGSNVKSQS